MAGSSDSVRYDALFAKSNAVAAEWNATANINSEYNLQHQVMIR
jgi:hypothetical protein